MKIVTLFLSLFGIGVVLSIGTACSKATPLKPADVDYYTCSMHPSVRSQKPDDPCPICGMNLIPVMKKTEAAKSPTQESTAPSKMPDATLSSTPGQDMNMSDSLTVTPDKVAIVEIAPRRLQAMGVTTEKVMKKKMARDLRTTGIVAIDESTLRDVNVKVASGFIDKLYANYQGKVVKKGEPLASILSAGWIEAQQDYMNAFRAWRRTKVMQANQNPIRLEQEINRMRARLRVWDLSDEQIKKLENQALSLSDTDLSLRKGQGQGLSGAFDLLSPIDGIVMEKQAIEGMKFEAGQSLFRLAGTSTVWVDAEFPENQAPYVAAGLECKVTFPAIPDFSRTGKIAFIYPELSSQTRRLRARIVLSNKDFKLLPGMYANVVGSIAQGDKLFVPASAVIPTGDKYVVFIDHGEGKLEPRYIQVGANNVEGYEVISGLVEGDRVITSANFLIDAESRIQGVLKSWGDNK